MRSVYQHGYTEHHSSSGSHGAILVARKERLDLLAGSKLGLPSTTFGYKSGAGYTLVEIMVTIAIITIMTAIFVGSYSFGKNFDTLKAETKRLSAVLRNARIRDFNGIIQFTKICTGGGATPCNQNSDCGAQTCGTGGIGISKYPPGGFGIHIDTNYRVCGSKPQISCYLNTDCPDNDCGGSGTGRTNYILFADVLNPDGGSFYDGGKTGSEFISEYKLPANLTLKLNGASNPIVQADIIFKGSTVTVYDSSDWANPVSGSSQSLYLVSANGCTNQTQNQKGHVNVTSAATTTIRIADELIPC